jgi:molybdopterin molybdotransferase
MGYTVLMLPFVEAQARVLALAVVVPAERIAAGDAAGRVLAEDVLAPFDLPGADGSAMDGYAVRTADLGGDGPFVLDVRGESRAGGPVPELASGATCRIFTGAALPAGADAVVMQEDVTRAPAGDRVTIPTRPAQWAHVRRRGEDMSAGARALACGTRLSPSHLALAATCDRAWLEVARRPVVTVIGNGDELRAPGSPARAGSIPDSNSVAVRAMAQAAGATVRVMSPTPDDRKKTEEAFDQALRATDLLVTSAGVSVGDHDLVRPALEAIGCTIEIYKVAIKPGKPLTVGRRGGALVLGLPGNPASAMVTFALFGLPLLRAMQGDARPVPFPLAARLARPIRHAPGRLAFVRAILAAPDGALVATPLGNQASGATTSMAEADALIAVPPDGGDLATGATVLVYSARDLGL